MSITDAFNTSEQIIDPSAVARPIEGFPDTVLVTFSQKVLAAAAKRFKLTLLKEMQCCYTVPVYAFEYKGRRLGIHMTCLGGSAAAGLLEEIFAAGAKRALFFGSCGVLDRSIAAGHFIVPTAAYRDEGTSYHYAPASDYIDIPTAAELSAAFDAISMPHVQGKTWTTDAIYRETRDGLAKRRAEGCITVEMECASVMAVGQFRKKAVYQFLYAEDCLDSVEWDPRIMGKQPATAYEGYLDVALECAIRVKG